MRWRERSLGGDRLQAVEPGGAAGGAQAGEHPGDRSGDEDRDELRDRRGEDVGLGGVGGGSDQSPPEEDAEGEAADGAEQSDDQR